MKRSTPSTSFDEQRSPVRRMQYRLFSNSWGGFPEGDGRTFFVQEHHLFVLERSHRGFHYEIVDGHYHCPPDLWSEGSACPMCLAQLYEEKTCTFAYPGEIFTAFPRDLSLPAWRIKSHVAVFQAAEIWNTGSMVEAVTCNADYFTPDMAVTLTSRYCLLLEQTRVQAASWVLGQCGLPEDFIFSVIHEFWSPYSLFDVVDLRWSLLMVGRVVPKYCSSFTKWLWYRHGMFLAPGTSLKHSSYWLRNLMWKFHLRYRVNTRSFLMAHMLAIEQTPY